MSFPIDAVRSQFPSLSLLDDGQPRVYLDNPAGTQVPGSVAAAVSDCLIQSNANLGGYFTTTRKAGEVVEQARIAMADFLGAQSSREITVGSSMTELTFRLARSLCRDFAPGDEIVLTNMDHEGNVAPWLEMAKEYSLEVRWAKFDHDTWRIEPEAFSSLLTERTRLVALGYASNMMGAVNDVAALTALAKQAGALVYVDAVQYAPHGLIDVQALGCDFLVCSAYKFFGPHMGVLWGRPELLEALYAYKCRCSDDSLPWKFELGTSQLELFAGLAATVEYHAWLGRELGCDGNRRACIAAAFAASQEYEKQLVNQLLQDLSSICGLTLYGPLLGSITERVPTVSLRHEKLAPAELAARFAQHNVFVWSGHNYAFETAKTLGIEDEGGLRIGLAHYNTLAEVRKAVQLLA